MPSKSYLSISSSDALSALLQLEYPDDVSYLVTTYGIVVGESGCPHRSLHS